MMTMKKNAWKHLLRSIRKGGVSFVAVAVIAAVSIAIFQGFQSSANAILQRADQYFADNNLETLEIACANGITEEDIAAIAGWDGVEAVVGGYTDSVLLKTGSEKILVQARSLSDQINLPVVLEGTLPTAENEAAIEEILAKEQGIAVGDSITLEQDGCLMGDTFTVTAIINQPNYCCASVEDSRGTGEAGLGSNEYYIALPVSAFDSSYYSDCYTVAYIDSDRLDGIYYYSDEYEKGEAEYLASLEPLAQQRAEQRYQQLNDEAQTELDDARAEIDDAQAEIDDGQKQLDDAKAEYDENAASLEDARTEIAENEEKLEDARIEIADGEKELEDAKSELASKESQYSSAQRQYNQQKSKLDAARTELNNQLTALGLSTDLDEALLALDAFGEAGAPLKSAIQEYQAGESQLAAANRQLQASSSALQSARNQIVSAEQELEDARQELADGEQELADAKQELADGEQELADAKIELEDKEQELADAKSELEDARVELADAEQEVEDLQMQDWILSGRSNVGDVRGIKTIVKAIYGLSYVMAAVFLLVAVVICFAAITRVIREQRVMIGAQKALGFTSGEILRHYMLYNIFCGVLGILLGWFLSVSIVELMSLNIFVPKFLIGEVPLAFTIKTALISAVICLIVFIGATYLTCARLVRQPATELLRGEVPARGTRLFFENWGFYQKMNLYSRTMIKNVLNDKGRMVTTIIGIVGCTALLVACFSMKLGIQNASKTEFDSYAFYDARLIVDSETGDVDEFAQLLNDSGVGYTLIQDKLKNFRVDGGDWENAHIVTTDDEQALQEYMKLSDLNGHTVQIPEEGVLVSRRAAENMNLSEGSVLELMDQNGQPKEVTVSGIIEHYLPYYLIVTSEEYYSTVLDEETDPCVFLLKGDVHGLEDQAANMDGFLSLRDNSNYSASGSELDLVIGICTALSAVMSVLVLLNQITMYIDRKARELAVMRVNGYTIKQTRAYVYKDNIVLIIMGLLFGCLFGVGLAYISVRTIEAGAEHFVRSPNLIACLISCVIGAVFAVAVNLYALRKINRLNLTNVASN